eukprot:scaffold15730_cov27-Cyclotella_meneghiniana.AAC.3
MIHARVNSSFGNFRWWPEIPVIIAIFLATVIMGSLCYKFYRTERRSVQYTGGETRLSLKLFKQSCWFVVAFYLTWVPYLTLQYMHMLSSGKGYDNYGLILSAATMVPLQGFWNIRRVRCSGEQGSPGTAASAMTFVCNSRGQHHSGRSSMPLWDSHSSTVMRPAVAAGSIFQDLFK